MKLVVLLMSMTVLAMMAGGANATHTAGAGPNDDFATGTVQGGAPATVDFHIHVNANSGPAGENPKGQYFVRADIFVAGGVDFSGRVTCLTVVGNAAMIGGAVERSEATVPAEGTGVFIVAEDNGEPGDADRVNLIFTATPPTVCPAPALFNSPILQGNFVVHDALP
jgi:hypothetical protein